MRRAANLLLALLGTSFSLACGAPVPPGSGPPVPRAASTSTPVPDTPACALASHLRARASELARNGFALDAYRAGKAAESRCPVPAGARALGDIETSLGGEVPNPVAVLKHAERIAATPEGRREIDRARFALVRAAHGDLAALPMLRAAYFGSAPALLPGRRFLYRADDRVLVRDLASGDILATWPAADSLGRRRIGHPHRERGGPRRVRA